MCTAALERGLKYKPEQASLLHGSPPPALGIPLGEMELETSLGLLEQLPSSREPVLTSKTQQCLDPSQGAF